MVETVNMTIEEGESAENLSLRLLEAVARARGGTADDLDLCLHEHVDVAALGELFGFSPSAPAR
ncbi:HalOD1 output domain-containing protein, partial [Halobium palmae]